MNIFQDNKKAKVYAKLYRDLKEDIIQAKLDFSIPIMGELNLAAKYRISRKSVRKALQELTLEGLLKKRQGCGTFAVPSGDRKIVRCVDNLKIAVILPTRTEGLFYIDEYDDLVTEGISEYCFKNGHQQLLYGCDVDIESIISKYHSGHLDGAIWVRADADACGSSIAALERASIPQMLINRLMEKVCSLHVDYFDEIKQSIDFFHVLGHKKIAFLNTSQKEIIFLERANAYLKSMKSLNLSEKLYFEMNPANTKAIMDELMSKKPTALVLGGHAFLKPFLICAQNACIKFPKDLSLICIGDSHLARTHIPSISVYSEPRYEMGKKAAYFFETIVKGQAPPGEIAKIKGDLVIRKTCAPPSGVNIDREKVKA